MLKEDPLREPLSGREGGKKERQIQGQKVEEGESNGVG